MTDTVFILGAGFSFDAGIPLLGNFIETMNGYALRKKSKQGPLNPEDLKIFENAQKIRNQLDIYHARANFRSWNIEDILSILSFEKIGSTSSQMQKMVAAIAKTIDLSCTVLPPRATQSQYGLSYEIKDLSVPDVYIQFWRALFEAGRRGFLMPALVTFNYDLVLERSFISAWAGQDYDDRKGQPISRVTFKYHYPAVKDANYFVQAGSYTHNHRDQKTFVTERAPGSNPHKSFVEVDLLKLHGSVNFPVTKRMPQQAEAHFLDVVTEPFLLPPVFNKMSSKTPSNMWNRALEVLRGAKYVVVVGYSLPSTDIYMQYFLKSALGPNQSLERIIVFDPVLWGTDANDNNAMRRRYIDCFSEEARSRIVFNPRAANKVHDGKLTHLVHLLQSDPRSVLWEP